MAINACLQLHVTLSQSNSPCVQRGLDILAGFRNPNQMQPATMITNMLICYVFVSFDDVPCLFLPW